MTSDRGDLRLIHHHVGGRAGDSPFDFPHIFEAGLVRVLYDADASSTEQTQKRLTASGRTTITRPYFIGLPGTKKRFTINYCPYTSTTRHLNPRFAGFGLEFDGSDYILGEATQPLRTIEIDSHGLDELMRQEGETLPSPDLLSLDAEGGEDDILAGARALLDDQVLAVTTEVVFNRVFSDGPLFGDIAAILFAHGFLFIEFDQLNRFAPLRSRLGTRSHGLVNTGDATFFKDPANVRAATDAERSLKLRKLAFVALCRAQLGFALLCLERIPEGQRLGGDVPAYLRFVDQFQRLAASIPDVMPWRFTEAYSPELSEARFRIEMPEEEWLRIAAETRARAARETAQIEGLKAEIEQAANPLLMVQMFERYGLKDAARIIRETQKEQVERYLSSVMRKSMHG
jgi:FkbM family methyltransferase